MANVVPSSTSRIIHHSWGSFKPEGLLRPGAHDADHRIDWVAGHLDRSQVPLRSLVVGRTPVRDALLVPRRAGQPVPMQLRRCHIPSWLFIRLRDQSSILT